MLIPTEILHLIILYKRNFDACTAKRITNEMIKRITIEVILETPLTLITNITRYNHYPFDHTFMTRYVIKKLDTHLESKKWISTVCGCCNTCALNNDKYCSKCYISFNFI